MKSVKFIAGMVIIWGLLLFLTPTTAQALELHKSADEIWQYERSGTNEIELKGIDNELYQAAYGTISDISFPSYVDGYKVTGVDLLHGWLSSEVKTVTLPEGVTKIDAFFLGYNDLDMLHTINFPASLTEIGNQSISKSKNVSTINFAPNSQLTSIGQLAFNELENLTSFDFKQFSQLKVIGGSAFAGTSLTSVSVGNNITIGARAFSECFALKTVSIGMNCNLEQSTFYKCSNLQKAAFGDGCRLGFSIFNECLKMTDIDLGNVVSLDSNLTNSKKIKKLVIPKSCTSLPKKYYEVVPKSVLLYVDKGSAAERYAKAAGYKYQYISSSNIKVGKVSSLKVTKKSKSSVKVTWKKVSGASGYEVYMKTNSGSYKKAASIKKGSLANYTKTKLKKNQTYTFKVRAYKNSSGSKVYGSYSSAKKIKLK